MFKNGNPALRHQLRQAAGQRSERPEPKAYTLAKLAATSKSNSSVAVVQAGDASAHTPATRAANEAYTKHNGYLYLHSRVDDATIVHPAAAVLRAFDAHPGLEFALWLGPSAAVRDPRVKVEPFVDFMATHGDAQIAFCHDSADSGGPAATSAFVATNSEPTIEYLQQWVAAGALPPTPDPRVLVFPASAFNSIPGAPLADTFVWNLATLEGSDEDKKRALEDTTEPTPEELVLRQYNLRARAAQPQTLLLLVYHETHQPFATMADALVRLTCARSQGIELVSVEANPALATAMLGALDSNHGIGYQFIGILSPGTTFLQHSVTLTLPDDAELATGPGLMLTRANDPTPLHQRALSHETLTAPTATTTHSTGLRRQLGVELDEVRNDPAAPVQLRTLQMPATFYSTLSETAEERDLEAKIWIAVSITSLLVILISGLVLRYGPVIHFKNENKDLNRGGQKRFKW